MNDCERTTLSAGECIPLQSTLYERQLMPPAYWSQQQQQQMPFNNIPSMSQHQQMFDVPSTSQSATNFQQSFSHPDLQQLQQFSEESSSLVAPYFAQQQPQMKQFQSHDGSNFSSSQFVGDLNNRLSRSDIHGEQQQMQQQKIQQRINSPSISSTADLAPNIACAGGMRARQMSPFQVMMSQNGVSPLFGRFSFLFTSDMANKAVSDVRQRQAQDFVHWHTHNLSEWHMQNHSTSRACIGTQSSVPSTCQSNNKSPAAPRSTKRKSSQSFTIQEQPHSLTSPLTQNVQQNHLPFSLGSGGMDSQHNGSKELCDFSTNSAADMFKRVEQIDPAIGMNVPYRSYMSPGSSGGQQLQNVGATSCRIDEENPLKKMEIMTSKTLNEPANKIARIMSGSEEQQQTSGDIATLEKMRKLQEIEKSLSHFSSQDGQQLMQMPNGGFCAIRSNGLPFSQHVDSNGMELPAQFRPPPQLFQNQMIPSPHFNHQNFVGGQMPYSQSPMPHQPNKNPSSFAPIGGPPPPFSNRFDMAGSNARMQMLGMNLPPDGFDISQQQHQQMFATGESFPDNTQMLQHQQQMGEMHSSNG